MRRTDYSDDTKAAVMAALLTGQSVSQVAAEYRIPAGTIYSWCTRVRSSAGLADNPERAAAIGDKLLAYLDANLTTLTEQQAVFRDVAWLKSQGASDLAVLHGVLTDKAIRLLEAMSAVEGARDPSSPTDAAGSGS